jgi:hypothetical protein
LDPLDAASKRKKEIVCCYAFTSHLNAQSKGQFSGARLAPIGSHTLVEVKLNRATVPHVLVFHAHGVCCSLPLFLSARAPETSKTA